MLVMGAPCDPSRKLELVWGDDLPVHWHLGQRCSAHSWSALLGSRCCSTCPMGIQPSRFTMPSSISLQVGLGQRSGLAWQDRFGVWGLTCACVTRIRSGSAQRTRTRTGSCINYMPKGSDRWPSSDANLDVIADNRGECPGKTLNWDTPKQCLELLLRT